MAKLQIKSEKLTPFGRFFRLCSMSESCGGGGSASSSGWGKKDDEDDWKFAHRCAQMAHSMCKPKPRSRSFHR